MKGEDGSEERWVVVGRVLVSVEGLVFTQAREHDSVGVGEDGGFICGGRPRSGVTVVFEVLQSREFEERWVNEIGVQREIVVFVTGGAGRWVGGSGRGAR